MNRHGGREGVLSEDGVQRAKTHRVSRYLDNGENTSKKITGKSSAGRSLTKTPSDVVEGGILKME